MFIQIGDLYINQDHITAIKVEPKQVLIWGDRGQKHGLPDWRFRGEERQDIINWLEYTAEVSKVC